MTTKKEQERQEAIDQLRKMLPVGSRVKTILRHVSASGMSRDISVIHGDYNLTYLVAKAIGYPLREKNGYHVIRMSGCGMDMGFQLVYLLGRALYPDGFIPVNGGLQGRNRTQDTELDVDGGYALEQSWL